MAGLNESEKKEMEGLQKQRKDTGGHLTDSERTRLSELQGKAGKPAAAVTTGTTPTK